MTKQYYYKDPNCPSEYNPNHDCTCWHDEGTGPCPALSFGSDVPKAYGSAEGLTWRDKPVTDNVVKPEFIVSDEAVLSPETMLRNILADYDGRMVSIALVMEYRSKVAIDLGLKSTKQEVFGSHSVADTVLMFEQAKHKLISSTLEE